MGKNRKPFDDEEEEEEEVRSVGPCQNCKYFDVDRESDDVSEATLAPCLQPDLEEFELTVSGDSGCNLYEPHDDLDEEDEDEEEEDEG